MAPGGEQMASIIVPSGGEHMAYVPMPMGCFLHIHNFTLVQTIPSILNVLNKSKEKVNQTSSQSVSQSVSWWTQNC